MKHHRDAFHLIANDNYCTKIIVICYKSQNDRVPLADIILVVETWLEKTKELYKSSLAGMHFKT